MSKDTVAAECLCYRTPTDRDWVQAQLLASAAKYFRHCYRVTNFGTLDACLKDMAPEKLEQNMAILSPFTQEVLIDDLKLCITFENYMKAVLLGKGFLIHKINPPKGHTKAAELKKLADRQRDYPIPLADYSPLDAVIYSATRKANIYPALSEQTLTISQLLQKPAYEKEIALPSDIHKSVSRISKHRNHIHYLLGGAAGYNAETIKDLRRLSRFVDTNVVATFNAWFDKQKTPPGKKLVPTEDLVPDV